MIPIIKFFRRTTNATNATNASNESNKVINKYYHKTFTGNEIFAELERLEKILSDKQKNQLHDTLDYYLKKYIDIIIDEIKIIENVYWREDKLEVRDDILEWIKDEFEKKI